MRIHETTSDPFVVDVAAANARASAQHDGIIWNYEHLSRNDGLSGNRVTALCDDAYGRIWIGTSQGLNIYDGRRLQKVEEYNGLEVWSFHDTGDRILIGTPRFLGVYDYASGRFSRLTCEGRDVGYVRTIVRPGTTCCSRPRSSCTAATATG